MGRGPGAPRSVSMAPVLIPPAKAAGAPLKADAPRGDMHQFIIIASAAGASPAAPARVVDHIAIQLMCL